MGQGCNQQDEGIQAVKEGKGVSSRSVPSSISATVFTTHPVERSHKYKCNWTSALELSTSANQLSKDIHEVKPRPSCTSEGYAKRLIALHNSSSMCASTETVFVSHPFFACATSLKLSQP